MDIKEYLELAIGQIVMQIRIHEQSKDSEAIINFESELQDGRILKFSIEREE